MIDLHRRVRKVERELRCSIHIELLDGKPYSLLIEDPELAGMRFTASVGPPSQQDRNLRLLHEQVYRARAREKYRQQRGLCAHCSRELKGQGQCDHIRSRGAHGRSDTLSNLQILCAPFTGGCSFHEDKHTKGKVA